MELHVAPMKGITHWNFRRECRGATDSYTGMIQLREILANKERALAMMDLYQIEGQKQWVQILTNSPREMAKLPPCLRNFSEKFPERRHIFGININVGCPDPQIISAGQGAALIKRRKRLRDLIHAFLSSEDHPYHLSLKFRLGMHKGDVQRRVLLDVLENLSDIDDRRLRPPIIHFKHAQQQSTDSPNWGYLGPLLDAGYAFVLNGGLKQPQDVYHIHNRLNPPRRELFKKNVVGLMVGRALISDKSLFLGFQDNLKL